MIGAEVIALFALLGLLGIGAKSLFSSFKLAELKNKRREHESDQLHDDLREALKSHDYRKLDDFIVLWGHKLDAGVMKHITTRRDELYIEANDK